MIPYARWSLTTVLAVVEAGTGAGAAGSSAYWLLPSPLYRISHHHNGPLPGTVTFHLITRIRALCLGAHAELESEMLWFGSER